MVYTFVYKESNLTYTFMMTILTITTDPQLSSDSH